MNICSCKDCRKMRKKGYILGEVKARHFKDGWSPNGNRGPYSAYVKRPNKKVKK